MLDYTILSLKKCKSKIPCRNGVQTLEDKFLKGIHSMSPCETGPGKIGLYTEAGVLSSCGSLHDMILSAELNKNVRNLVCESFVIFSSLFMC